jgi:hypothetical protein
MGMLAYGAMAGVGGEYLEQSAEKRKNDFTLLRDKRLSELKKGEATHASALAGGREAAARKHGAENYTAPLTSNVYRDGKLVQTGQHRPTAGSGTKNRDSMIQLISGDMIEEDLLRKQWEGQAFTKDDFGAAIRNPDVAEYDEWRNARVVEKHRINPQQREEAAPVDPDTASIMEANQWYDNNASWLESDKSQFGMTEKEVKDKKAREIMAEKQKSGRGGMLSESAEVETPKPTKTPGQDAGLRQNQPLKAPLSQAAKTDPAQMYDELAKQGFGDQDIEDTIRQFFKDPTWTIPARSTM